MMIGMNFLLRLEKELEGHLPPKMELKIHKRSYNSKIKQDKNVRLNVPGDFK